MMYKLYLEEASTTRKNTTNAALDMAFAIAQKEQVVHLQSRATSTTVPVRKPFHSDEEVVEANNEEIIALFLQVEPNYEVTNRMLADL